MTPIVSVVSGTYNRLELLQRMVQSARDSAGDLPLEIVLVDGGSTDGTQDWCRGQPDMVLVEHGELRGAIKAYNDGCDAAQGPYIVIGNDDITFVGDTIHRAYVYLEDHPEIGQVAFGHQYQRRPGNAPRVQGAYGYHYGQCCMTPKRLGDRADWWGREGMRTYGGDTRLSLRLWEMGYPTMPLDGCSVIDWEHEDELREINSDSPWRRAKEQGRVHPDLVKFTAVWSDRLPGRGDWIPAPSRGLLHKAWSGRLRSMRFKSAMTPKAPERTALIDALAAYGPTRQVNQTRAVHEHGRREFQAWALRQAVAFEPDLVLLQAQRENNIAPETVREMQRLLPDAMIVNWDGDAHPNLNAFHYAIAREVHLQLVVSPALFPLYAAQGIGVGYWPIGIEQEYLGAERADVLDGPDVVFLGGLTADTTFPGARIRREAVEALAGSDLDFLCMGQGWATIGMETDTSIEAHADNAALMAQSKLALSISHFDDLWGYTSDRLYNITATGCPALVQRFAGMEQHGYVDGQTCIVFETVPEMLDKAQYYVEHEAEREAIGAAGRAMTHQRHTWAHRVEGLLAMLEGLP